MGKYLKNPIYNSIEQKTTTNQLRQDDPNRYDRV